jgi:hypothetical protein
VRDKDFLVKKGRSKLKVVTRKNNLILSGASDMFDDRRQERL